MSERVEIDRSRRRRAQAGAGLCLCLAAATAAAQQMPVADADRYGDQTLALVRQVQPRVAYVPVPARDNPVRAQAITFPGEVFHSTLDRTLDGAVGDEQLGERGSVGVMNAMTPLNALPTSMARLAQPMQTVSGRDGAPMGTAATIGGVVNSATRDLGATVQRSLAPLTGASTGRGP